MPGMTLVDTGPLVALLDRDEEQHAWATDSMRGLTPPLQLCEAVLTETCFLLKAHGRARLQLRLWIENGFLRCVALEGTGIVRALALMERYASVPMSFADACLMVLAESMSDARLFTLDQDFLIFRRHDGRPPPLLAPFAQ